LASVDIVGVRKSYGPVPVIHGVDIAIGDGEFVVLVGPSGCGKSTLLRMIAGLESISGGDIRIGGDRVNDLPPRSRDIAMVFQDYALYPHKTVRENIGFGLRMRGAAPETVATKVAEAAQILQIGHLLDRRPGQLSGGQRQRVAMGRAIVREPRAFLFDEPLSNLDAQLRSEMRVEIKKLHQRLQNTMIYVTHDQVEAMTLADRIAVMRSGHLEQLGTPDDIYNRPRTRFVAGFTGSPPMNFADCAIAADGASLTLGDVTLSLPGELRSAARSLSGRKVSFGIRPEHIQAGSRPGDGFAQVRGHVVLTEPLGSETLARVKIGNAELTGRFEPDLGLKVGQTVDLSLAMARAHLFDEETGLSALWGAAGGKS